MDVFVKLVTSSKPFGVLLTNFRYVPPSQCAMVGHSWKTDKIHFFWISFRVKLVNVARNSNINAGLGLNMNSLFIASQGVFTMGAILHYFSKRYRTILIVLGIRVGIFSKPVSLVVFCNMWTSFICIEISVVQLYLKSQWSHLFLKEDLFNSRFSTFCFRLGFFSLFHQLFSLSLDLFSIFLQDFGFS